MASTPKRAPKARQDLTERIAVAMVGPIGFELLDHTDGDVAARLAARAAELADAVLATSEFAQ